MRWYNLSMFSQQTVLVRLTKGLGQSAFLPRCNHRFWYDVSWAQYKAHMFICLWVFMESYGAAGFVYLVWLVKRPIRLLWIRPQLTKFCNWQFELIRQFVFRQYAARREFYLSRALITCMFWRMCRPYANAIQQSFCQHGWGWLAVMIL